MLLVLMCRRISMQDVSTLLVRQLSIHSVNCCITCPSLKKNTNNNAYHCFHHHHFLHRCLKLYTVNCTKNIENPIINTDRPHYQGRHHFIGETDRQTDRHTHMHTHTRTHTPTTSAELPI